MRSYSSPDLPALCSSSHGRGTTGSDPGQAEASSSQEPSPSFLSVVTLQPGVDKQNHVRFDTVIPELTPQLPQPVVERRCVSAPTRTPTLDGGWSIGSKATATSSEITDVTRGRTFLERTHTTSMSWAVQMGRTVSGTLNRHGVNVTAMPVVPTQRCNICLESVPSAGCVVPRACGREAHSACADCMTMYVKHRVEEGRVTELWCPCAGSDGCNAKVAENEIEAWTSTSLLEKYRRFIRMKNDSKIRACPECNELCSPSLRDPGDANSPIVPELECGACGCSFCYYHSNAHAVGPKACEAYEREILKQERTALAKLHAQKCPACGVLTEKTSGCNHMTCQCKCEWCWVCGKEITNVGWHYHPLKPLSCAQYNERTAQRDHCRLTALMTITKILTYPGALCAALFMLVIPPVFLVMVVAQFVPLCATCCCCFVCCICIRDFEVEDLVVLVLNIALAVTVLLVGIPFFVFCLAWCVVALPLWLVLLPLGAGVDHFLIIVSAPVMTVLTSMECVAAPENLEEEEG